MVALFNVSLLLCVSLCVCVKDVRDRAATPFGIEKLCSDTSLLLANKKVVCILCKGWDPSCWSSGSTPTPTTISIETKPNPPSQTTKTETAAPEAPTAVPEAPTAAPEAPPEK